MGGPQIEAPPKPGNGYLYRGGKMARAIGSAFLEARIQALLAADVPSLGASTDLAVRLAQNPFDATPDITAAMLTEADFGGYVQKSPAAGTSLSRYLTIPDMYAIGLRQTSGLVLGWSWTATSLTNLPQTIYGWWVQKKTGSVDIMGCERFATPVVLSAINDIVDVGNVWFRYHPGVLS